MRQSAVSVLLLLGMAPLVGQQPTGDAPSFRSESTELVVLPVVVHDRQGRLVSDLARDRFVVYDDGRRQELTQFTNEDAPVTVGLVVDNSGSMREKLGYVRAATLAFARWSHPDDEIFTIAFNDAPREIAAGRAMSASDSVALQGVLNTMVPEGMTALYDALMLGLDRVEAGTRARKVLVLISDGGDNASRATLKQVLGRARNSNVTIYTLGLFDDDDPDRNPGILKDLANATGGARFLPPTAGALLQSCEQIAREIRSGYTLGYVPPDHDGRFHAVRVQIERTDARSLTVRTRPGYFADKHP